MIGRTLGHHRIIGQLGQGGMGVVYLAEDTRLGRRVALKVLPPEMASDPARRARFEREARAVATLNHPNIVTIHSVEQAEGVHFLTMELVDGRRLTDLLAKEGVALPRLLEWSVSIAEALGAAHRQGVVHRDLKPDNIMVTSEGRIKVLDFGLAKLREPAGDEGHTAVATASVTGEGKILGTVSYMSPEQAEGKPLDHRSDIFSFGVVLYEMATGRRPFRGDTPISTISSILKDIPPPPQQINTALPEQLGRIVRRCLAKEPERRYQSTDDLRNELRELKEESESGEISVERSAGTEAKAEAAPRPGGSRALLLGGVGLAVVLAAGGIWLLRGERAAPATSPSAETAWQMSRATNDGKVQEAAISPDGRYIAYVRRDGSQFSLRLRQVVTGEEVQVVAPSEANLATPAFSADGDFLHYVLVEPAHSTGWVHRVSVLGGTPRRIVDGANAAAASPDGRQLAITGAEGMDRSYLRLTGVEGDSPRDVAERHGRDHFDSAPAWSGDGRMLAIVSHRFGEPQQIALIDPAMGSERSLKVPALKSINYVTWMPGGNSLLVAGSELPVNRRAPAQIWRVSLDGQASALTRDLNGYDSVTVMKDGSTVAAVQIERRSGIDVAPVKDSLPGAFSELFPISAARSGIAGLSWLNESGLLHTALQGDAMQIFLTDVATGASRPITSGAPHHEPVASRDGATIVMVRDEGDHSMVWGLERETWREKPITEGPFDILPSLTADGSQVLYTSAGEPLQLLRKPVTGGDTATLLRSPVWCLDVSLDARVVCVSLSPSGETQWVLVPLTGGEPAPAKEIPPTARMARFGPDGRTLTWLVTQQGVDEIWSQVPGKAEPRRLARFEGERIGDFAWSSGGTRVAVVTTSASGDVVLMRRPSP